MQNSRTKARMMEVLRKTLDEQAKMNLPFVYRDKSCVAPNQFIHRYPDGRKVLIQQNPNNSAEKVIKVFNLYHLRSIFPIFAA